MQGDNVRYPLADRRTWLWFAVGLVLLVFSSGRLAVPLLAWVAPVFFLRFMRSVQRVSLGLLAVALAGMAMLAISWRGMIAIPPPADSLFIVFTGLLSTLPLWVDRRLTPRLGGFTGTLVFPLASTVLEFANMGLGSPLGSFGATAYSQAGNLVLLQLLSVTGIWGLTLLMAWPASLFNWAWERGWDWPELHRGLMAAAAVLSAVWLFGEIRLAAADLAPGTVRVAAVTAASPDLNELMPQRRADPAAFRTNTAAMRDAYFAASLREARAGAEIVLWPEGAGLVAEEDEPDLTTRAAAMARDESLYLAVPFFTLFAAEGRPPENRLRVFGPSGELVLDHVKYGGNVIEGSLKGDGKLRWVDTPFGRLSGVICWDTDFIPNIRQAGRQRVDILLSPAHDWEAITPLHGQMSVFRAIENGLSVVRLADQGLSIVADPYGRTLAAMDHFRATERVMVAQVPLRGVATIYARIGDLCGWLSVLGLALLAILGWRRGRGEPDGGR